MFEVAGYKRARFARYPAITLTILLYNSRMQLQNNMYMIQSTIGSFPCLLIQSLKAVTRV